MSDRIEDIKKRLAGASQGPWGEDDGFVSCGIGYGWQSAPVQYEKGEDSDGLIINGCSDADGELIANAPSDLTYLLSELERRDRIIEVMDSAIKWIMPKVHQGNHEEELAMCQKATCTEYKKLLAAVVKIREGKDAV